MTPLPPPLGSGGLVAWRLDLTKFKRTWDSGKGARLSGGRWNNKGTPVVYCSLDPATAILEVAAHVGFSGLDTAPRVLTSLAITDIARVKVVLPADVPNPHWLLPGTPGAGQKDFGDSLLASHAFVVTPSTISARSWNLIFNPSTARGQYKRRSQEPFALDTRLHPPGP